MSGSANGIIHIYDLLTGGIAMKIDTTKELIENGIF
jgi:hypothetical protein